MRANFRFFFQFDFEIIIFFSLNFSILFCKNEAPHFFSAGEIEGFSLGIEGFPLGIEGFPVEIEGFPLGIEGFPLGTAGPAPGGLCGAAGATLGSA